MTQTSLHFSGPFSFLKGENSLFHSKHSEDEGIYLWVIKDTENNINYIHYVGETTGFASRQREHLIRILGLDYCVIDTTLARQGVHKMIWKGMWRDKSKDAAGKALENYDTVSQHVVEYIGIIDVYFAPIKLPNSIRKHIEGCVGWNLRENHEESTTFYPRDCRVGRSKTPLNEILTISSDEPIAGLDSEIEI